MIEICGNGVECIHSAYNVMNIKHSEYRYLWSHSLIGLPQVFYALILLHKLESAIVATY